jgi:predicted amidohydrolase YtcJ
MSATLTTPSVAREAHSLPSAAALKYFYNGVIRTMNPGRPTATHLLLAHDRILHCDDTAAPFGLDYRQAGFAQVRRELAREVEFIDLQGRTVLPGLVDSHVHFIWWALNLRLADLGPARSEDHALELLRANSADTAPGEWIVGFGWSHNLWDRPALPSAESLDRIFPNNPVYLSSKCGHVAWVNSAAMAAGEISHATKDPFGGEIERKNGRPTGILKETANALVHSRIPAPTDEQRFRALDKGQKIAHSLGLTGMHTPEDLDTWGFLQRAHETGRLSMRVNFWIPVAALSHLEALQVRHGLGDDRLRISAVKLFSDGSLGGRTALMHEPYENEPDNRGICVCEADEIRSLTLRANRCGLAMAIHAIGDKAVHNVLRAYEAAQDEIADKAVCAPVKNRVEHLQVYSNNDMQLLRKVRPVASMQPVHLCADMGPADRFWGSRSQNAYAFSTLQEAGCTLAFGSDAPVEPINPFYGLYAAVSRRNLEGLPENGWHPAEKLPIEDALQAYTWNTAVASGQTNRLGSLEETKLADFIILDADPLDLTPEQIRDLRPAATYSGGQLVHSTEQWLASTS